MSTQPLCQIGDQQVAHSAHSVGQEAVRICTDLTVPCLMMVSALLTGASASAFATESPDKLVMHPTMPGDHLVTPATLLIIRQHCSDRLTFVVVGALG